MDATVNAVGVAVFPDQAAAPKVVSPLDGIIDAVAAAVISRLDFHTIFGVQLTEMSRRLESELRVLAEQVVEEYAVEDSEAMRKVAEDVFESKIEWALENYDCSDAIDEAISDINIDSKVEDAVADIDFETKVEEAFDNVDLDQKVKDAIKHLQFSLVAR